MPTYDGKLYTLDLTLTLGRFKVHVQGTVEALDIRRVIEQ